MTPHRSNDRGSFIFDRLFDGIGRVRLASGTDDAALFRQMDAMLTTLYVQGKHDILRLLKQRKLAPAVAWHAFRLNALDKLPNGDTITPLGMPPARRVRGQMRQPGREGVWLWLETFVPDARARSNATSNWRNLIEHGGVTAPILNDLPAMLRTYRAFCRVQGTAAMFNRTKAAVQAYLGDVLGASHALYQLASEIKTMPEQVRRRPRVQTPDQMRRLVQLAGPDVGACAWGMALTGMLPKEYWGEWAVIGTDHIHIEGTKRASRVRDVPFVYPITRPRITRTKFEDALATATDGRVSPKDFRNTFSVWLVDAGVPANRRKHYRGHSPQSMADLYERVEITQYLADDARRLRAHIGDGPVMGLRIAK